MNEGYNLDKTRRHWQQRRTDLCVIYNGHKYPIEIKIFRSEKSITDGLTQLAGYMDKTGENSGWLVMFDRDTDKPRDSKIFTRKNNVNGKNITVIGC